MKLKINIHFIYVMLSAILWGIIGVFIRNLGNSISQMGMVFGRSLFTTGILSLLIVIKDKKLFKIKFKDLPLFISAGILSIVLFNYSYFKAMSLTSLSVASVLLYTAPFFVVIMSVILFKEKLNFKKVMACITAFIGCVFVSGVFNSQNKVTPTAVLFGLISGIGYALYTVFSRILINKGYNTLTITFYIFLSSSFGCLPFQDINNLTLISFKDFCLILLMAVFSTVLPYIFYTKGLLGVEASAAPIIATIEPIVATIVGVVVFAEKLTVSGVAGIIFVLGSVVILNVKEKANENKG